MLSNIIQLIKQKVNAEEIIFCISVLFVVVLSTKEIIALRSIELDINSNSPQFIQIFYDIGNGFMQRDSDTTVLPPSTESKKVNLFYPNLDLKMVRLDPLMSPGIVNLESIKINDVEYSGADILPNIARHNQVELSLDGNTLKIESLGSDPFLEIYLKDKAISGTIYLAILISIGMILIFLFFTRYFKYFSNLNSKVLNLITIASIIILITISSFYVSKVKLWDYPDEIGHYSYVKDLSDYSLPLIGQAKMNTEALKIWGIEDKAMDNWIIQHPPLYYIFMLPVTWLSSFAPIELQVRIMRAFSFIFSILNIIVIYKLLATLTGDRLFSKIFALLITTIPMYVYISSGISNDILVSLLTSTAFLYLTKFMKDYKSKHAFLSTLALAGASITKMTVMTIFPAHILVISFFFIKSQFKQQTINLRQIFLKIFIIISPFLLPALWMYRSLVFYGSPLANSTTLTPSINSGNVSLYQYLSENNIIINLFESTFASMGWMGFGPRYELTMGLGQNYLLIYAFILLLISIVSTLYYLNVGKLSRYSIIRIILWITMNVSLILVFFDSKTYSIIFKLLFSILITMPVAIIFSTRKDATIQYARIFLIYLISFISLFFYTLKEFYIILGSVRAIHGRYLFPLLGIVIYVLFYPFYKYLPNKIKILSIYAIFLLLICIHVHYFLYKSFPFFNS